MKKALLTIIVSCVLLCSVGCDIDEQAQIKDKIKILEMAIEKSEKPVSAVEEATGFDGFDKSKVEEIEKRVAQAGRIAEQSSKILTAAKVLVGNSNPYVGVGISVATSLAGLAGVMSSFLKNRKLKKTEAVAVAVMKAADPVIGIGKKINKETLDAGVANEAQELYQKHVAV